MDEKRKKVIVGIGELLWDVFPTGKAIGGAPANFAYHAKRLGEEGWAVSAIGDDELGRETMDVLRHKGLATIVEICDRPTGTVQVTLDDKGVPSYDIKKDVAWDNIPFTGPMRELAHRADAVCFGSLVQRMGSRESVLAFVKSVPKTCLKVFDINLRQDYYSKDIIESSLELSDIFKINDEEIGTVSDLLGIPGTAEDVCRTLIGKYNLRYVILTKGADGSEIVTPDEVICEKAAEVDIVDTVGAGDAFTAAFVVSVLRGDSLSQAQKNATETAGYVCSKKGAMPD
jgi:fructokinase